MDINYNLPQYAHLISALRTKFGNNLKRIGDISDVICGPFGSAIKTSDYQESGIPLIRIANISKDGYMDYSDIIYISEELGNSLSRTQVSKGDIVISQRGSLGQCAVVDDTFPVQNISANIIAVKNIKKVSAQFIHDYLLSTIGHKLLERSTSGQVQQKITTQDIADILIPIGDDENKLSCVISRANERKRNEYKRAENIVIDSRKDVLKQLGLAFPDYKPALYSYIRLKNLLEFGIVCNTHSSFMNKMLYIMRINALYAGCLEDYVEVNPPTPNNRLDDNTMVSFVPMASVEERNNVVHYEEKRYFEVKNGFTAFKKGDLLWAKITPCMQNGKAFCSDEMPTDFGFGSTEFHVLRKKNDKIHIPFLWVLLTDSSILESAQGMFSGSAGQQRVSDAFLKKLPIVLPPLEVQIMLADKVFSALKEARAKVQLADSEWADTKAQFEKELLGET
ncbi:MAG: restriction endonuclease subunit S [Clostridia bacterium]|nr:restriction endonuclease subunit S [Clostridia bacterium]